MNNTHNEQTCYLMGIVREPELVITAMLYPWNPRLDPVRITGAFEVVWAAFMGGGRSPGFEQIEITRSTRFGEQPHGVSYILKPSKCA